jgi:hypothetical protein
MQHENHTIFASSYLVACGLSGYTILLHITPGTARFAEKVTENKICFDFPYKLYLKYFLF